jgi:hypothetical protein
VSPTSAPRSPRCRRSKIATRLAALATQADGRLAKACDGERQGAPEEAQKARKPCGRSRISSRRRRPRHGIGAEQRAELAARTDALVSELQALAEAA